VLMIYRDELLQPGKADRGTRSESSQATAMGPGKAVKIAVRAQQFKPASQPGGRLNRRARLLERSAGSFFASP